jgi:hypothetical protein
MTQPTKEQIRKWQQERVKSHEPPPDPMRIRRELGWGMMELQGRRAKHRSALR